MFWIVLLCLVLFGIIYLNLNERKHRRAYNDFLVALEGKNFFCYNNKEKSLEYVQTDIIPLLPKTVEPIFLNGRHIVSDKYEPFLLSSMFYRFKNYKGFPQLVKIRSGAAIDMSLNNELFSCMNEGKSKSILIDKMKDFFELNEYPGNSNDYALAK